MAGCAKRVNSQDLECQAIETRIWDTVAWKASGEPIVLTADLTRTAGMLIGDLHFSPDGSQLAIATSEEIRFWDMGNGKFSESVIPTDKPGSIAYAPSGRLLAVDELQGNGAAHITLWDLTQMQPLGKTLVDDSGRDSSRLVFSKDDATLISTSGLLWDLDPAAWKARVCQVVQRNFTAAEWTTFMGSAAYRDTCSFPGAPN